MINLINGMYEKLGSEPDADQIEQCLGDILSSISMHFALEERLMQNSGYEEYAAHKDDHEELLEQIRDLMDDYVANPQLGAVMLKHGLSDWFAGHFSTFDARLHGKLVG